jgi:hypothetical protein
MKTQPILESSPPSQRNGFFSTSDLLFNLAFDQFSDDVRRPLPLVHLKQCALNVRTFVARMTSATTAVNRTPERRCPLQCTLFMRRNSYAVAPLVSLFQTTIDSKFLVGGDVADTSCDCRRSLSVRAGGGGGGLSAHRIIPTI